MTNVHGRFVWYELMTTDPEAAKSFYGKVVGWGAQDAGIPGVAYTLLKLGAASIGGLMALPEEARRAGAPPSWIGYVGVDDVDAVVDRIKQLGGRVSVPPSDIPDVGRFAVVSDPQQAMFALFKPLRPAADQPPAPGTPGTIGWHELMAVDWEKAFAFYSGLFGWQKAEAVDMGAMGKYQLFSTGGHPIGGMFNKPAAVPAPFWLYYINVDDIDAAVERVKAGGGQIVNSPMEVPGGSWIVQCTDPQRAMFALVEPKG
jgi:predicted enzyme related to lactoylglutathione lyase